MRGRYPPALIASALTQQSLRLAAREKFGEADRMLFTRAGLEQASSDLTARQAATRFGAATLVADLCCGIGGNLGWLAADQQGTPRRVVGFDSDFVAVVFARHNAAIMAPEAAARGMVAVARADVTQLRLAGSGIDGVFIDPARRTAHGRRPSGRYQPPLDWCLSLVGTIPAVGIKAAPGIDRERIPPGWEAEFVAVGRELKEAKLWSPGLVAAAASSASTTAVSRRMTATILPSGDTLSAVSPVIDSAGGTPVAEPGGYLLDPNPAVTRAGLVAELAERTGTWQIDPQIAFLSTDHPVRTPFARTLRIIESAPWHEKDFARRLRVRGIGAADIRRRGLAGDVAQIHRRLGLRGPGRATIVITRVRDRPWGLICAPLEERP